MLLLAVVGGGLLVANGVGCGGSSDGPPPAPELPGVPSSVRLHILGMTGLTAYVGLSAIARLQPGETVFVSGAAGAVGR